MKDKRLIGTGLVTALAASLCCITPVLAIFAGSSGLASSFSWLEPFRPYLIGITIVVLGFAWYQKLKPKKSIECNCESESQMGKSNFLHGKFFLGIVTVFAGIMLAFPVYAHLFYSEKKQQQIVSDISTLKHVEFLIEGMTCDACSRHIDQEITNIKGILKTTISYKNGLAQVDFDSTKTNVSKIKQRINSTGYKVVSSKEL